MKKVQNQPFDFAQDLGMIGGLREQLTALRARR